MSTAPPLHPRTLSIGGATFDLFVYTDKSSVHHGEKEGMFQFPLGAKIRVQKVISTCGGGASNTAVGLARLGCGAHFAGVVADDQWGSRLLENLVEQGVDISGATIVEGETSSFSMILLGDTGERVILYDPGTNAHLHDITFDREQAKNVDWLFLNHIQADSCEIQNDLVEILAQDHPHLTWNPGGCQIQAGMQQKDNALLLRCADLVVLNKEEAAAFTGGRSIRESLHRLHDAGSRIACITDGKRGATATDGTSLFFCPAPPCPVVDTTGAGDAFETGFTWALIHRKDLPTCLKAGTMNAMSVVGQVGAQAGLLTDTEMQKRISSLNIDIEIQHL